jgi:hypothetical protein
METYPKFSSIPRLFRDVIVTEKIDGTNGLIEVREDGTVRAGSRSRWLTPGKTTDNFGFAAWVEEHAEELKALGPGLHYGEWWGQGIQMGYGLTERRFSLFNVGRWTSKFNADEKEDATTPGVHVCIEVPCCHVVPIVLKGVFSEALVQKAIDYMEMNGSYAAPDWMQAEGIVVYHEKANQLFKVTLGGDGHKGTAGFRAQ